MTGLETEQMNQLFARNIVDQAEKNKREALDFIPKTIFTTSVAFLSILMPLFCREQGEMLPCRKHVYYASLLAVVSITSSVALFFRTIRISNEVINQMSDIVYSGIWKEPKIVSFRWWDYCCFIIMVISFLGAGGLLIRVVLWL